MVYSMEVFAQTKIEKSIAVPAGNKIVMDFEFPELIQVHTWDKKEVLIRGQVSINHGESDDAFQITSSAKDGKVSIESTIKDRDKIPKRITIRHGGEDVYFKTDDMNHPDVVRFIAENGGQYQYMSHGINIHITLEIFVPQGVSTHIESKFGMVEIAEFNGPLTVSAKHGGVDAQISKTSTGQLTAKTKHGEIFTNLDSKFEVTPMKENFHDALEVKASVGGTYAYNLEAIHGRIYLRKPKAK